MNKHGNDTMKKLLLIVFLICLKANVLFCQTNSALKGAVVNDQGSPVDFFDALLLSTTDSSFIKGNAYMDGIFEFNDLPAQSYILRISSVQYNKRDTIIYLKSGKNELLKPITLTGLTLSEVVVKGKLPLLTHKRGALVVNVKNSFLKDAGSLMDVLRRSPGVLVGRGGEVSVYDKGKPIIFIDNKEVKSTDELRMLQSTDIESVEINRNPTAEYAAAGYAVIKIKTKKILKDILKIDVANYSYVGRKYSDGINLSMSNRINKVSNFLSYTFDYESSKQYDTNEQQITSEGITKNRREGWLNNISKPHKLFYSFMYDINRNSTLGFQYSTSISTSNQQKENMQFIRMPDKEQIDRNINILNKGNSYLHNFSLNYKWAITKKSNLSIIADYAFSNNNQTSDVNEYNINDKQDSKTFSSYMDDYKIYGMDATFNSKLRFLDYKVGVKFSGMEDKGAYSINDKKDLNQIDEKITALYFLLDKKIKTFSFSLGLRMEQTNTKINTSDEQDNSIKRNYLDFFPSLQIQNDFSDNISATFTYARKISRPGYSQMNPRYRYLDSLSYIIGNPLLKPSFSNVFELGLNVHDFSASVGYRIVNDRIVNTNRQDTPNSSIVKYSFDNQGKAGYLIGDVSYSFKFANFSGMANVHVSKQFMDITYLNETYRLEQPLFQGILNMDYKPFKGTTIFGAFYCRSNGDDGNVSFKGSNDLTLGIQQYLLKQRLYISVSVEDIFKTSRLNNWENRDGYVWTSMDSNYDSRQLVICLRYNIGTLKLNSQKKSANTYNLNRM